MSTQKEGESSVASLGSAAMAGSLFEALNAHDADKAFENCTEDFVDNYVVLGPFEGKDTAKALVQEMFDAFPDFAIKADKIFASGNEVCVQWSVSGTFTGKPFRGVWATGKKVALQGCDVLEVEGGKFVRNTVYYDGASFARQIGILPPEDSLRDDMIMKSFNISTFARREFRTILDVLR